MSEAMKAISFARTSPALVCGRKRVTRRAWQERTARSFKAGELVAAYDRQRQYGGRQIAVIRLVTAPYRESTAQMPDTDYAGEGFDFLDELDVLIEGVTPRALWINWRTYPKTLYVVRFQLVELTEHGEALRRTTLEKRERLRERGTAQQRLPLDQLMHMETKR